MKRSRGFEVIGWIETHCVFTQGEWIGQPFRLLPWQKRLILELFSLRADGRRVYRWAYISVPKKNGKTEILAAIGLYLLIGDGEPSPNIAVAAASEKQADLVFGAAKKMCELSPTLRAICQPFASEIHVPTIPGAVLRRLAAEGGTNDGPSYSAVLLDELHEWRGSKGEDVWNILTNSTGARRQPLVVQITTAGYDLDTICGRQYLTGQAVARGEIEDPAYLFWVVEAPVGCDHRDPRVWEAANPSFGVTVQAEFYEDQLLRKSEGVFRRYFLNQWTETEELAMPAGAWADCQSPLELDRRKPLYVGIDFAQTRDSTAVVRAQAIGDRIVMRSRIWSNPWPATDKRRDSWVIDHEQVANHLRELSRLYPKGAAADDRDRLITGPAMFYDPARFELVAQTLRAEGLNMVRYDQTDLRMVPCAETFRELVVSGRLAHDGDQTVSAHVAAIRMVERPRGGWRIGKFPGRHNDAAVAAAIATYECQRRIPSNHSVYERRGFISL